MFRSFECFLGKMYYDELIIKADCKLTLKSIAEDII